MFFLNTICSKSAPAETGKVFLKSLFQAKHTVNCPLKQLQVNSSCEIIMIITFLQVSLLVNNENPSFSQYTK